MDCAVAPRHLSSATSVLSVPSVVIFLRLSLLSVFWMPRSGDTEYNRRLLPRGGNHPPPQDYVAKRLHISSWRRLSRLATYFFRALYGSARQKPAVIDCAVAPRHLSSAHLRLIRFIRCCPFFSSVKSIIAIMMRAGGALGYIAPGERSVTRGMRRGPPPWHRSGAQQSVLTASRCQRKTQASDFLKNN